MQNAARYNVFPPLRPSVAAVGAIVVVIQAFLRFLLQLERGACIARRPRPPASKAAAAGQEETRPPRHVLRHSLPRSTLKISRQRVCAAVCRAHTAQRNTEPLPKSVYYELCICT